MSKYNMRIVIRAWGSDQNDIGSPVAVEVGAWPMWAQVGKRNGFSSSPYQQDVWQYDYEIRVRYERTRLIGSNYTIDYDGKRLVIQSLEIDTEAYRAEYIIRCRAMDDQTGTGGGGSVVPLPQIGVYNYTGVGDEQEFTAGILANKFVFSATKDGVSYKILRQTGAPADKEVLNIKQTGRMLWSTVFVPDEKAIVLYI